ncbi:killer cell lectin-like receptor subfamily B member 1B allele B isoform X1 [Vidua chalybeata]|uniref:killer cell lectin-like receptor subfamily B member 1B allele B isoform X1 n=1 Tax=Vidua chalybeata TaxID=81927 RepID=UPI0023A8CBEC|nr:killer cell lectin-like receptor subfamily B member 1B allele B isoform X1 [Vidua chalybeata]
MAENVLYADLNLPEPTRPRNLRVPDVQGKSHGFRTRAAAVVAVLVVIILLMVIALYLTLTMAGSQQDSTTLASTSQNVSTPLFPTSQEDSTKLPPSHEEAPGKSCCSTTRVAVLVTEIILLLLIVVCQILPCKSRCSRTQVVVLVVVLVPIVLALTLSWTLPYGPTAGSQQDSTRTIPEEALGCPTSWKKHGRNCYFFSPEKKPKGWEASRAECTAMGSDLVVIDSREELSYLLPQSRHNYYLLGLTYSQEEQKWKWINNVEHDPAMFSIIGHFRDYLCTVIGFGAVESAPCNGSKTVQNMCEKAATIS